MEYTNNHNLPLSVFQALMRSSYDLSKTDQNILSVTSLIEAPKVRQLKIRHWQDLKEDASENLWKILGSSVHWVMEGIPDKDRFKEERLNEQVDGTRVTGRIDLYEAKECIVQDYKVTSAWSVVYAPEGKIEWERQLNAYAWLYRKAGFEVKGLRIVCLLRDWQKSKVGDGYPQIPIVIYDVPLWDVNKQQEYIESRVRFHKVCMNDPDDTIPECSPEERWATPDVWAVHKGKNIRATKLCKSYQEAEEVAKEVEKARIEFRKGEDKKCIGYCQVREWCHYGKKLEAK